MTNTAAIESRAEEMFGVTSNLDLAGYITTQGKLLRFSSDGHMRDIDHREIVDCFDDGDLPATYGAGLIAYMNMGAIRLSPFGIDISVCPTEAQWPALRHKANNLQGEMVIDFSKEDGNCAGSCTFRRYTPFEEIKRTIVEYYNTDALNSDYLEEN